MKQDQAEEIYRAQLCKQININRRVTKERDEAQKNEKASSAQLSMSTAKCDKLSLCLHEHIEKRSTLIRAVRQNLESVLIGMATSLQQQQQISVYDANGKGLFVGIQNQMNGSPYGPGIMLSSGKHRDIIVGNWDQTGKLQGQGFKLQNNKVAFCGNWRDGKYDGNSLYFSKDESF